MQLAYEKASKTHPFLREHLDKAAHLDRLFPQASDIEIDEIRGRGSYHWLVFRPAPDSPYRVALPPDFPDQELYVTVYGDVSSDSIISDAETEATLFMPSAFVPVRLQVPSIDALPERLDELEKDPIQPVAKRCGEFCPDRCIIGCGICVMISYLLGEIVVKSKCLCCCGRVEEDDEYK